MDPFPASEFDQWANQYDKDVADGNFPFTGYYRTLAGVVQLADANAKMTVLDLGTGTGNLSEMFVSLGCELWCTDFSAKMIEHAHKKLPSAYIFLHDLRQPFPPALIRRFDRIVSAYVFHHFELPVKMDIIKRLMRDHLVPGGRLVIADISFPTRPALNAGRQAAGDRWDEEPYWIAAEMLPALENTGFAASYMQTSDCAGIYLLSK